MDPAATLGFVVYDKLDRRFHLGFRSQISDFFSIKGQIGTISGFAADIGSLLNFLTLFPTLKNVETILICKEGLKNSPRGLDLACGDGSSIPILGNTILTLKISIIAQREKW